MKKDTILRQGGYITAPKQKNKHNNPAGLNLNKLIRTEMGVNGYPSIHCEDVICKDCTDEMLNPDIRVIIKTMQDEIDALTLNSKTASYLFTHSNEMVGISNSDDVTWQSPNISLGSIIVNSSTISLPIGIYDFTVSFNIRDFDTIASDYIKLEFVNTSNAVLSESGLVSISPKNSTTYGNGSQTNTLHMIKKFNSATDIKIRVTGAAGNARILSSSTLKIVQLGSKIVD